MLYLHRTYHMDWLCGPPTTTFLSSARFHLKIIIEVKLRPTKEIFQWKLEEWETCGYDVRQTLTSNEN